MAGEGFHQSGRRRPRRTGALAVAVFVLAVGGVAAGATLLRGSPAPKASGPEAGAVPWKLRLAPEALPASTFRDGPEPGLPGCRAVDVAATMSAPVVGQTPDGAHDVVVATVQITNNGDRCNLDSAEVDGAVVNAGGQDLEPTPGLAVAGVGHAFPPPLERGASATTKLMWSRWCGEPPGAWAARVRVGGTDLAVQPTVSERPVPECWPAQDLADKGAIATLDVWTLVNQFGQPAANPQAALQATFSGPQSAAFGDTLRTSLRLHNPTAGPISLTPCPRFTWSVSNDGPTGFLNSGSDLELNCPAAPDSVAPGGSVTFELELALTANLADGAFGPGRWWVSPGLGSVSLAVEVTEPDSAAGRTTRCAWAVAPDTTARVAGTPPERPDLLPATALIHTDRGDITVELNRAGAPCAVTAFRYLVEGGYWTNQPAQLLSNSGTFRHLDFGVTDGSFRRVGFGFPAEVAREQDYPAGTVVLPLNERLTHAGGLRLLYGPAPTYADNFTVLGRITTGLSLLEDVVAGGQRDGEFGGPRVPITIESVQLQ